MATIASRPALGLRARAVASATIAIPLGLGGLLALSLYLRTRQLDVGYWIDEGLSVGIADRPLIDIPGVLRQDGSPPLYYVLLHLWIAVLGRSEEATHAFSVTCALATIPIAFFAARALFGDRAGWIAGALAALNPFITQYSQETRMYALTMALALPAAAAFVRAFVLPPQPRRRAAPIAFGALLAALLYTHNWALFFGISSGVAWLLLIRLAEPAERRPLVRDGAVAYGTTALLYAPWIPSLLFQTAHTGAPWAKAPTFDALVAVPNRLLGGEAAEIALILAAGAGIVTVLQRTGRNRPTPEGRALIALLTIALLTILLAWLSSQVSPAWANRYLSVALAPLLFAAATGLARAGRLGLVALAIVALMWSGEKAPGDKSNVKGVSEAVAPSLAPGDLVVSTQPEQVPVLAYYLPEGLRFATLWGPVQDLGVTDWRDGVDRLRATTPQKDLAPLLDALPPGRRLVLVQPTIYGIARWSAPWTELVRLRSEEWAMYISNDQRFEVSALQPQSSLPVRPNAVNATVYLKTRS